MKLAIVTYVEGFSAYPVAETHKTVGWIYGENEQSLMLSVEVNLDGSLAGRRGIAIPQTHILKVEAIEID